MSSVTHTGTELQTIRLFMSDANAVLSGIQYCKRLTNKQPNEMAEKSVSDLANNRSKKKKPKHEYTKKSPYKRMRKRVKIDEMRKEST